jgi:hypothetical protein
VRFLDEDHRDGGDFIAHRASRPAPEAWVVKLRALAG